LAAPISVRGVQFHTPPEYVEELNTPVPPPWPTATHDVALAQLTLSKTPPPVVPGLTAAGEVQVHVDPVSVPIE
jgi:hypothetical protein